MVVFEAAAVNAVQFVPSFLHLEDRIAFELAFMYYIKALHSLLSYFAITPALGSDNFSVREYLPQLFHF